MNSALSYIDANQKERWTGALELFFELLESWLQQELLVA